jgi:cytochrome c peroxidase
MRTICALAITVSLAFGCSDGSDQSPPSTGPETPAGGATGTGGTGGAGAPSPDPLTAGELDLARGLSPLPAVPADPTNRFADDPGAARLGQMLFFDPRYAGPLAVGDDGKNGGLGRAMEAGKVSCASCHLGVGLDDRRSQPGTVSLGVDWLARNSLSLVNASHYVWVNWAGRFSAQWELPLAVAENAKNMNSDRLRIAHLVFQSYRSEYELVFGPLDPAIGGDPQRFPPAGKPKPNAMAADGVWEAMADADRLIVNRVFVNYGKALAAYLRRLVSGNSRFDRFVAGGADLSPDETAGFRLFAGKARCLECHGGPRFSDGRFHALAVPQTGERVPMTDLGRWSDGPALLASAFNSAGAFSDDPEVGRGRLAGLQMSPPDTTRGQFRTPSLRGVAMTAPYMHAGQLPTLEAVIDFYDAGGGAAAGGNKSELLQPLGLTPAEKRQLVAFLHTLTGEPVAGALLVDTSRR